MCSLVCIALHCVGLGWVMLGCVGLDSIVLCLVRLYWVGLQCVVLDWIAFMLCWIGLCWIGLDCVRLVLIYWSVTKLVLIVYALCHSVSICLPLPNHSGFTMTKSCAEEQSRAPQAKDSTPCLDTHFKDPPNLFPPSAGLGYSQPSSFREG